VDVIHFVDGFEKGVVFIVPISQHPLRLLVVMVGMEPGDTTLVSERELVELYTHKHSLSEKCNDWWHS